MFTSFVTLFLHVASADRVTVHDDEVSMMQGLAKTVSLHASTPALCCHAMTPECVACTLGTEDIEAFCCSASNNHDQCTEGGVEYEIQQITADISSTTTYSLDGLTCTHHVPVCCEANTPVCVACKLGIATDDIEALCCSASADHSACTQGGVEYAISVDLTADPNLIGTTYSWDGSTTCAVSTLEQGEYELVGGGGPGYKCDEFMFSSQMYDSRADCALACFQYSPEGGAAGINDKTRTTEPLCTHYNWNKNSGRCRFCVGDGTQSAGNNNAVYHNDVRLAPSN